MSPPYGYWAVLWEKLNCVHYGNLAHKIFAQTPLYKLYLNQMLLNSFYVLEISVKILLVSLQIILR